MQEDPAPDAVLIVQDDEVKADKWVSQEQAQQHEAEQQASASKSSGSQQGVALRGVRQMLGDQAGVQGGLQGQAQVLPLELARQPWMDLPDSLLMPQQRALLKEHDKKVQVSSHSTDSLDFVSSFYHAIIYILVTFLGTHGKLRLLLETSEYAVSFNNMAMYNKQCLCCRN